jgi:cellulose synthase/poly-beta-1,6-N-acetylglucosamine synthase-like glycosyltransferase
MKKAALTVILPVLNEEKYLDYCLKSIFGQVFTDFKLICINDGSTDHTGSILAKWKTKFGSRMLVVTHPKNIGFTKSLNEGLALVDTKWTARIDADDYWHADKLKVQMSYLISHPNTKLIGCAYINLSDTGQKVISLPETDVQIRTYFPKGNPFGHSCVVFETKLVKEIGGYDRTYYPSDDYELWFRISNFGQLYNVTKQLCYRRLGDGISINGQNRQLKNCLRIQHKIIQNRNLSVLNYIYLVPTLLTLITPGWIRSLKRRLLN